MNSDGTLIFVFTAGNEHATADANPSAAGQSGQAATNTAAPANPDAADDLRRRIDEICSAAFGASEQYHANAAADDLRRRIDEVCSAAFNAGEQYHAKIAELTVALERAIADRDMVYDAHGSTLGELERMRGRSVQYLTRANIAERRLAAVNNFWADRMAEAEDGKSNVGHAAGSEWRVRPAD